MDAFQRPVFPAHLAECLYTLYLFPLWKEGHARALKWTGSEVSEWSFLFNSATNLLLDEAYIQPPSCFMSLHSTALFSSTLTTEKSACIGPQLQKMSRGLSPSPILLLMREVSMGWVMLQKQKHSLISSQLFFKWLFGILCEFLLSRNIKIIALSWAECFLSFFFIFISTLLNESMPANRTKC